MEKPTCLIADSNGSDDVCGHWKAIPSSHWNRNTEIEKDAENGAKAAEGHVGTVQKRKQNTKLKLWLIQVCRNEDLEICS